MTAFEYAHTQHDEHLGIVDIIAEWLLVHCPFTTITVLTALVLGSTIDIPRPELWAVIVPAADVLLNLVRRHRRARRAPPTVPA